MLLEKFPYPVKKTKLAPWTEKLSQGNGSIISDSTKQKVNSRSSTEAELIGADAEISEMPRTKRFIEHQGINIALNILCQDNASTIKLAENGEASLAGAACCRGEVAWWGTNGGFLQFTVAIETISKISLEIRWSWRNHLYPNILIHKLL